MFVTFITIITFRIPFYQIMEYRDTRAYILDPCIQGIFILVVPTYVHEYIQKRTLE